MNTRSNTYLKDNFPSIEDALREVFQASDNPELITGKIIHIDYKNDDCGSFFDLGSKATSRQNDGPGIRIIVNFGAHIGTHKYFYPENECESLESFLDNLNTDFGMAQVMHGKSTASLNIEWYDLNDNKIQFNFKNQSHVADNFNDCWNVGTLIFNVNKFLEIRAKLNAASSYNTRSVSQSLSSFPPPSYPNTVQAVGIDKNKFLNRNVSNNI